MWGALRLLVALLAASPFGPISPIDARASEFPTATAHVCDPGADEDVLFAEIPDDATVQDLIFLGSTALAGLGGSDWTPQRRVTIRSGDTFVDLLALYKVPRPEALEWYAAAHRAFDLRKLRPGQTLTLTFEPKDRLVGLEYEIDTLHVLLAERDLDGKLIARREEVPTTTEVHGVSGTIASNMTADCMKAGVPRRVVSGIEGIFSSKIRFGRLRKGDTFRMLYEVKVGPDGKEVRSGKILAAEVHTGGTVHTALQAERSDGKQVYLDMQGKPLVQEAANRLGFPLKFTRISSRFSSSRLHPILRRRRPHYGVDFAAPRGTPVRAIADGKVIFAHWEGQLGRAVRIEHSAPSGFDSIYGHLSGFARGVRSGAWVSRGDVIGYVGSTGLATGPHLHFALVRGEHYVDPLKALQTVQVQTARYDGKKFERRKAALKTALDALDRAGPVRLTRMGDTLDL